MCKHSRPYLILIDSKFSESCQCAETIAESPKFIVFPYNCMLFKKYMSMHLWLAMMFKGFGQPVTVTYPVPETTQAANIDQCLALCPPLLDNPRRGQNDWWIFVTSWERRNQGFPELRKQDEKLKPRLWRYRTGWATGCVYANSHELTCSKTQQKTFDTAAYEISCPTLGCPDTLGMRNREFYPWYFTSDHEV